MEALGGDTRGAGLLKIATPYPFPEKLARSFYGMRRRSSYWKSSTPSSRGTIYLCGKHALGVKIHGKLDGSTQAAGENSVESAKRALSVFLASSRPKSQKKRQSSCPSAARPLRGLSAQGFVHRGEDRLKGERPSFAAIIGCYTLGNAMPLDMVDTCLCMGAGVTIRRACKGSSRSRHVALSGDSTFFAAGITGV
jgi:indolepyruvate ferredoxin oxidoreductase alpha subunit